MHAVRVNIETPDASVEYLVHVRNRSCTALQGAVRSGWRRFPQAKSVCAEYTQHACPACTNQQSVGPVRRTFRRVPRTA